MLTTKPKYLSLQVSKSRINELFNRSRSFTKFFTETNISILFCRFCFSLMFKELCNYLLLLRSLSFMLVLLLIVYCSHNLLFISRVDQWLHCTKRKHFFVTCNELIFLLSCPFVTRDISCFCFFK